jgi:hypothetical protein
MKSLRQRILEEKNRSRLRHGNFPQWYGRLVDCKLFGNPEDKIIQEIRFLGGDSTLLMKYGISFDRNSPIPTVKPPLAELSEIKAKLAIERIQLKECQANGEAQVLGRRVISDSDGFICESGTYVLKRKKRER